jgi:hypothetical protein
LWSDLVAVVKEIRAHLAALSAFPQRISMSVTYHDTGHSLDRGLEWMAKPEGKDWLIIAVNVDPNPLDVSMQGPPGLTNAELSPRGDAVTKTSPGIRLKLAPFDVQLIRIPIR